MANTLPYVTTLATLERMLTKIKEASVPERFTQDFVSTKLGMKGGTANAIIPFIKKMGLVHSDGTPTSDYKAFRNPSNEGQIIAKSMKTLYKDLYDMNEYAHELNDKDLKGLIIRFTGLKEDSQVVGKILGTYKILKKMANFDEVISEEISPQVIQNENPVMQIPNRNMLVEEGLNLSYTINLNLPSTTDINVYNAIFKSLKEHLL